MTLGELWIEFGDKCADMPLVLDMNGEGAVPVRGATDFTKEDGSPVLLLTNMEGVEEAYGSYKD